jgi:alpha-beta hydrolase superfamily lysophospholipase
VTIYRRWKQKFNLAGSFTIPARAFQVVSDDGVRIFGSELSGTGEKAYLVVHGLLAHHRAPGLREFAQSLTRFGPVWSIDLRGHGFSAGASTLGRLEALDVAAAVKEIRRRSELPLVAVGFSMGAASVVRAAALYEPVDAVVAISSPARWGGRRRWAALRTRLIWQIPGGTTVLRLATGVRIERPWRHSEHPSSIAGRIAPAPLLVVHGTADQFFPPEEAEDLFQSGNEPKALWMIPGAGHATGLYAPPDGGIDWERVDRFVTEIVERVDGLLKSSAKPNP